MCCSFRDSLNVTIWPYKDNVQLGAQYCMITFLAQHLMVLGLNLVFILCLGLYVSSSIHPQTYPQLFTSKTHQVLYQFYLREEFFFLASFNLLPFGPVWQTWRCAALLRRDLSFQLQKESADSLSYLSASSSSPQLRISVLPYSMILPGWPLSNDR